MIGHVIVVVVVVIVVVRHLEKCGHASVAALTVNPVYRIRVLRLIVKQAKAAGGSNIRCCCSRNPSATCTLVNEVDIFFCMSFTATIILQVFVFDVSHFIKLVSIGGNPLLCSQTQNMIESHVEDSLSWTSKHYRGPRYEARASKQSKASKRQITLREREREARLPVIQFLERDIESQEQYFSESSPQHTHTHGSETITVCGRFCLLFWNSGT